MYNEMLKTAGIGERPNRCGIMMACRYNAIVAGNRRALACTKGIKKTKKFDSSQWHEFAAGLAECAASLCRFGITGNSENGKAFNCNKKTYPPPQSRKLPQWSGPKRPTTNARASGRASA